MKHFSKLALVLSGSLALITTPFLANSAIDKSDEKVKRLDLQGQIDNFAPFSKTLWAGAHNAYASHAWNKGTYTDVNQYYSPESLLWRGMRVIEYDIYPEATFDSTPMLCHNSTEKAAVCSVFHAKLSEGLDDIKDFLEANPDEVIMLKIESYKSNHHSNWHNKIGERLQKDVGDILFIPSDWGYTDKTCASLPVSHLSKRDILAAGKQLVAVVQTPRESGNLCSYHKKGNYSKFWNTVFIGVDAFDSSGNLQSNQPLCQNNGNKCVNSSITSQYEANNMTVVLDAATQLNPDGPDPDKRGGNVINGWAKGGAQILELALVEANNTSAASGYGANEVQIEDYIWSWNPNRPNGTGSCASIGANNMVSDNACNNSRFHACVDDNRNWKLSTSKGSWQNGFSYCKSLGGSYKFGMPYNAYENAKLAAVKANTTEEAWVNYYNPFEDFWLANSVEYIDFGFVKKNALGSTNQGSAFDGIAMLKRKALVTGAYNLSYVQINFADTVRGIKACYKTEQTVSHASASPQTQCITHGSTNGVWSGPLRVIPARGEYLAEVEICRSSIKYGYDSIFYVSMKSSSGQIIAGGSKNGTCSTYSSTASQQIFGFHGSSGSDINALGIYKIGLSLLDKGLYATPWLDRDDPSNGDNELFANHQSEGRISSVCSADDIAGVVARVVGNKLDSRLTGQTLVYDGPGFRCLNSSNGGSSKYTTCEDYEVKYFFTNEKCVH